ncbi:MAG: hypothetical protein C4526_11000, partial [Nitrospiraceae bacterium]
MRQDTLIRNLTLFFLASLGLFVAIAFVFASTGPGKQLVPGISALLISAGAFAGTAVYIFKKKNSLKASENTKERSDVGFVVDTFHDLVGKLKEKEKELERLKAFAEEKAISIEAYN